MLRNTTDVFRKTMNFDVWQMVDPIKVGAGQSCDFRFIFDEK
jgi:hypothetical protein